MSKIIDRNGYGAAIPESVHDTNIDSLNSINEAVTSLTYTVDEDDQNRVLEFIKAVLLTGTTDGVTENHLLHTAVDFAGSGVLVGDYVKNTADGTYATITSIAIGDLTLSHDIFISGEAYEISSKIAVTLTDITTIIAAIHTSDYKVSFKNPSVGGVVVTCGGSDTFDNGGTTVTLNQYETLTIQTDSTGGKWNRLSHSKTELQENLKNKTLVLPVIEDTNAHKVLEFGEEASAANHLKIFNRAGTNRPYIKVEGAADVGMHFRDSNDNIMVMFGTEASAVNRLELKSSATGNDLEVAANGSDTDIDIQITPKGAGTVSMPLASGLIGRTQMAALGAGAYYFGHYLSGTSNSATYVKVAEFHIAKGPTVRIKVGLYSSVPVNTSYARVRVNGVAAGTERTTTSGSMDWQAVESISVSENDLVQLYVKSSNASNYCVAECHIGVGVNGYWPIGRTEWEIEN